MTLPKHGPLRDLIIQFSSQGIKSSPLYNIRVYCSVSTHLNCISRTPICSIKLGAWREACPQHRASPGLALGLPRAQGPWRIGRSWNPNKGPAIGSRLSESGDPKSTPRNTGQPTSPSRLQPQEQVMGHLSFCEPLRNERKGGKRVRSPCVFLRRPRAPGTWKLKRRRGGPAY